MVGQNQNAGVGMPLSKEELDEIKAGVVKAKQKTMYFGFAKTRKPTRGHVDKAKLKDPLLIIEKTASKVQKDIRAKVPPH